MGFVKGDFPPVDEDTFLDQPLPERIKALTLHWVEYGFGSPRMIHTIYVVKILLLYVAAGVALATWTSGAGPAWDVAGWWDNPLVYQKLLLWTVLLEALGLAGSWGPLAGKFTPMTGGVLFWARPGTIRLRPWRRVPFTSGDRRTPFDVLLYLALLTVLGLAVVLPGADTAASPDSGALVSPALLITAAALLVLCGLRDKTIFLAARGEQYLPALVFFAVLDFTDMIIALKLLIAVVWIGAGVSKFGRHFANVVPPMVSNSPCIPSKWFKRQLYRDAPHDIRPSGLVAGSLAHVGGTCLEIVTPLVLLLSTDTTVTLAAVGLMVVFHLFIASTFPLAVPLEWNVLFAYASVFLFAGFPAQDGYGIGDMSSLWLTGAVIAALAFFPVLGNLRPDLVSFLPSMRQYAGNWASALWVFAPGAESRLDAVQRPTRNQKDQLLKLGYTESAAEITLQQTIAWRSMHSQGRGLFSVLRSRIPDLDRRAVREAEFVCNSLIGFNFGDGHLHNEDLIAAVQSRCGFAPGELVVVWVESQAIHSRVQHYKLIDAALGVIERGIWRVADAVREQPWLPNGPIPLDVTWSHRTHRVPRLDGDEAHPAGQDAEEPPGPGSGARAGA
ncbi:DUF3556 domain-containing protein [Streptomyces ochraceiscleroticus]|uniref:DUF3556 domain-containing protein n=1 Tax=Streptomyces ochraceiscleroticus TaxID=47761 RepID=A0ABW1MKJ3_9ACTN|nr:DUF3556 domain-containing protein [Streptomyces ochraceiscleroticus]